MNLAVFRHTFNAFAEPRLEALCRRARGYSAAPVISETLAHVTELFHGGKRLRPYTCFLAYSSVKGADTERIFELGLALELFHLFCLVHDDIMDDSPTRHGVPTIHTAVGGALGQALAILAGDLLASWAMESVELATTGLLESDQERIHQRFAVLREEVIVGQMLDVQMPFNTGASREQILEKTYLKTARYTFVHPLALGLLLAGSSEVHYAESFGSHLGLAFQLQDDKHDLHDAVQNQQTYFTWLQSHQSVTKKRALQLGQVKIDQELTTARTVLAELPQIYQKHWQSLLDELAKRSVR